MRRRSTFVHDPTLDVDPRQLYLSGDHFVVDNLKAAREEKLTFAFTELPEELWQALRQSHELHVRWASEQTYNATPPLVSRTSPGLHIFYTPLKGQSGDLLCPLLRKIFSATLKCQAPNTTFTSPHLLSGRFASTSSLQYHSVLPSLKFLTPYIQRLLCKHSDQQCVHSVSLLNVANTVDIDYDGVSNTLTCTAHWSRPPAVLYDALSDKMTEDAWSLIVDSSPYAEKVEVGVLSNEATTEPSELTLSGFLTVVGEDERPNPTLFSFPSRHHALPPSQIRQQEYTVSFIEPTGLHPTMQIAFPDASSLEPPSSKPSSSICALHAYLTLPSPLFADKYQLSTTSDSLFLRSHNLVALRSISGETDLEAPDYIVDRWGSNLLLQLATPNDEHTSSIINTASREDHGGDEGWNVSIPLHLRYLPPAPGGYSDVEIPWPVVFWACAADEGAKFPVNPFDRVNLGYEGLFGPRTMFYHVNPHPPPYRHAGINYSSAERTRPGLDDKRREGGAVAGRLVERIRVPILDTAGWAAEAVERGTVLVVLMGFAWVCWRLWLGYRASSTLSSSSSAQKPHLAEAEKTKNKKTQ